MQRIALPLLCLGALSLAGCKAPSLRTTIGPPPDPLLSFHARAPRPEPPKPPPPPPSPPPTTTTPSIPGSCVQPRDVQIPGGIEKDKWQIIVVHHSAAPQASPDSMHRHHRDVRGWNRGLGYHFVIGNGIGFPDGQLFVGPRWMQQATGAHCKTCAGRYLSTWCPDNYFNEHGIGICLIGDFETEQPTDKQLQTLHDLIAVLVDQAGVHPGSVFGHGEVTQRTACPGRNLDMYVLRRNLAATHAAQPPAATVAPTGQGIAH